MVKRIILPVCCALAVLFSGCETVSKISANISAPAAAPSHPVVVGTAKLKGSEESSALFDNFTAFVVAVNGLPVAAGRAGWNTPVEISAGNNTLTVEFNRGNFFARTDLELTAKADASYEVKFASDAKIFGLNSYCDFWIADLGTGQAVTPAKKVSVKKR
jgi:hypothetical protein